MIRKINPKDWEAVKAIYIQGIKTGYATFETPCAIKGYEDWIAKKVDNSVFVWEENNQILGWASLSPVSSRCVYGGVAEVSVYIHQEARGKGIGTKLLQQLIDFSEANDYWTLEAGIFPENQASVALHQKLGFRVVGHREKIGQLKGVWRDNLLLERRSKRI